jgi:hypothetical protein
VKPPGPDLMGGISSCLILWRDTCPGYLSPPNGDLGSTQIWTQHYGAQSQTVSQLKSLGNTPNSKFLQFSSSGLSKHLRMGLVLIPHHILTT